jgi:hypothetical protein
MMTSGNEDSKRSDTVKYTKASPYVEKKLIEFCNERTENLALKF